MTDWWSPQAAALIGGIGGGGLGALCGILGAAAGVLAPKGIGRVPILVAFVALLAIGALALVAGVVAVVGGQPYHVYYPLLLAGAILCAVTGPLLPVVNMRFRQAEQRRLEAEQIRRS